MVRAPARVRLRVCGCGLRLREGETVLYRFGSNPCLSLNATKCYFPPEEGPFLHETPASAIWHLAARIGMGPRALPDKGRHRKGQA